MGGLSLRFAPVRPVGQGDRRRDCRLDSGRGAVAWRSPYALAAPAMINNDSFDEDDGYLECSNAVLAHFLDGLVVQRRGRDESQPAQAAATSFGRLMLIQRLMYSSSATFSGTVMPALRTNAAADLMYDCFARLAATRTEACWPRNWDRLAGHATGPRHHGHRAADWRRTIAPSRSGFPARRAELGRWTPGARWRRGAAGPVRAVTQRATRRCAKSQHAKSCARAIDRSARAYFQPVWDLQAKRICGAESLARWTSDLHGEVSPATFVLFAEQSDLILALTRWSINATLRDAAPLHGQLMDALDIWRSRSPIWQRPAQLSTALSRADSQASAAEHNDHPPGGNLTEQELERSRLEVVGHDSRVVSLEAAAEVAQAGANALRRQLEATDAAAAAAAAAVAAAAASALADRQAAQASIQLLTGQLAAAATASGSGSVTDGQASGGWSNAQLAAAVAAAAAATARAVTQDQAAQASIHALNYQLEAAAAAAATSLTDRGPGTGVASEDGGGRCEGADEEVVKAEQQHTSELQGIITTQKARLELQLVLLNRQRQHAEGNSQEITPIDATPQALSRLGSGKLEHHALLRTASTDHPERRETDATRAAGTPAATAAEAAKQLARMHSVSGLEERLRAQSLTGRAFDPALLRQALTPPPRHSRPRPGRRPAGGRPEPAGPQPAERLREDTQVQGGGGGAGPQPQPACEARQVMRLTGTHTWRRGRLGWSHSTVGRTACAQSGDLCGVSPNPRARSSQTDECIVWLGGQRGEGGGDVLGCT
ncbi:MAG: hypothetical protein WDW38_009921 [Sanguina aurantia]